MFMYISFRGLNPCADILGRRMGPDMHDMCSYMKGLGRHINAIRFRKAHSWYSFMPC